MEIQPRRFDSAPVYSPEDRYNYEMSRFNRQFKFVVIGGVAGSILGLALGVSWAVMLPEQMPAIARLAAASSITLTGLILGSVSSIGLENITAPKINTVKK